MQTIKHRDDPLQARAKSYPYIGDQLDAIYKLAAALREQGTPLPDEVLEWIDQCAAVKDRFPKDQS